MRALRTSLFTLLLTLTSAMSDPPTTTPVPVTKGPGNNNVTADVTFATGRTLTIATGATTTYDAGSTLTLSGSVGGTPTGGTLNLSNTTLTVPAGLSIGGTVPTAAGLALLDDASATVQRATMGVESAILNGAAVVWEGDSITNGYGITAGSEFRTLVYADPIFANKSPSGAYSYASDGATIATLAARYSASVYPRRPAALGTPQTFLFVMAGTNDVGTAAATVYSALASYWTTAKADGFTVVAFTIPVRSGEGNRQAINALIRKSSIPDYIVDIGTLWADPSDTDIFQVADTVHPNDNGQRMIYREIVSTLLSRGQVHPQRGTMANQSSDAVAITGGSGAFTTGLSLSAASPNLSVTSSGASLAGFLSRATAAGSSRQWIFGHDNSSSEFRWDYYNGSGWMIGILRIGVDGSLIWEGTTDAFETTLTVTDPTADRTVTIPNLSGTVSLHSAQTVALAADDQSITVTGSLIEITSDDATGTNRTFVLAAGSYAGQRITLMFRSSGNNCELLNTGTAVLTAAWEPGNLDTLDLIYSTTESKWVETARAMKP